MKQTNKATTENSFEAAAQEWHAKFPPAWVAHHAYKIIKLFERKVFPWLDSRPIANISSQKLLAVLRVGIEGCIPGDGVSAIYLFTAQFSIWRVMSKNVELTPIASPLDPSTGEGILRLYDSIQEALPTGTALRAKAILAALSHQLCWLSSSSICAKRVAGT